MGYALTAGSAAGVININTALNINGSSCAGSANIPYAEGLNLISYLDAAHTFDALLIISDKREALIPFYLSYFFLIDIC